ncbi:MAG: hypothetical protein R3C14_12915 [Caldilineaceae bacterium]
MSSFQIDANALSSIPALAVALRTMATDLFAYAPDLWSRSTQLAPMYRVHSSPAQAESTAEAVQREASAASQVISEVVERLHRLVDAYGEWQHFDASAYFDLLPEQTAQLIHLVERVSTVHVIFHSDLLLPSFHQAVHYWQAHFAPAYHQLQLEPTFYQDFLQTKQPTMIARWRQACQVADQTRALLLEDVGFLAANGAQEERLRWRSWWEEDAIKGIDTALLPQWRDVPTVTLSLDFPLPAFRQPGRIRRLRRNREHQRVRRQYYHRYHRRR